VRAWRAAGLLLAGLAACDLDGGSGYIEIKAVPPSLPVGLYLDAQKLEPIRNGTALLRQKTGTAKLQAEINGQVALICNVQVKKDRITSVTVTVMTRQARCQCGRTAGPDPASARTCIG